ncbi:MAG: ATP-dependent RNA helicase RhlE [Alphaproteobacteria bacterium]
MVHKDTQVTISNFSELGLAEPIERALTSRNHLVPTPIQARSIPQLLEGKDMLGIAQTGTGKTGAFALPILHKLSRNSDGSTRNARALVLAPTRELAIQIGDEFRAYGVNLHLRQTLIYGGVSQKPQVSALQRGLDIIIATPGRLLDLMNQGFVKLNAVEFLVLDEGDRMLDMGFIRDIRKIIAAMPKQRQTMLFSATMPNEIARLSGDILINPVRVEVTPQATPIESIEQSVYYINSKAKGGLLSSLLEDKALKRVIVFTRTKHRANRVADHLEKTGISADAIHGNKSQNARQKALQRFRDGHARVLVATDVAARGIDIDGVTHVINYEIPNEPDSYVHRIGRTARAGASGVAVAFCDSTERGYLRDIEKLIKRKLSVIGEEPAPGEFESAPEKPQGRGRGGSRNGANSNARPNNSGGPAKKRSRPRNRSGGSVRAAA